MNRNRLALSMMIFFLVGCTSLRQSTKDLSLGREVEQNRLSNAVIPQKYDLTLWTTDQEEFSGLVNIDLSLKEPQSAIVLHSQDLVITGAVLKYGDHEQKGEPRLLNADGLTSINFAGTVPAGEYQLSLNYSGNYNKKNLNGLYRVKEGEDHYIFSQFEPIFARKMMPCFDEPRFKTPFKMTVIANKGDTVIANSPLDHQEENEGTVTHFFADTEPLSTYLLALAVGPFDVVEGKTLKSANDNKRLIPFRGIATKGKGARLAMAMRETPQILKKLEKYFGVPYPFQKLDIIAVPDFAAGAMENAGAITFREWLLLMDEKNASVAQQQAFYEVMAHELAHQWFGNRVTMAWWDDLWLNEAFATWLSFKIVDKIKPEYKLKERLIKRSYDAMVQDGTSSVRKIRENISTTHDIHNAFDGITYLKGGAVLSMWESYIGEKNFQKAVSHHVKRFPFGIATSRDFLESLASFSKPDLIKSAESFLNQSGFPSIEFSYACNKKGFSFTASQARYLPMGSRAPKEGSWDIPLCIGYESKGTLKKECFMMSKKTQVFKVANGRCPAFVVPNIDGQGYYRFALSEKDWQKVVKASHKNMSGANRMALADSLVGELYTGRHSFAFVIEGLRAMTHKDSPYVTRSFMNLMSEAHNFWISPEQKTKLMAYAQTALRPLYDELKKAKKLSSDAKILKRDLAHFLALTVNDDRVRADLTKIGESYYEGLMKSGLVDTQDELMVSDALAVILQDKEESELKKMMEHLNVQRDSVIRNNVLAALSHSRRGEEASIIRNFIFDKSLRQNELLPLFYNHLRELSNQPATWSFIKNNIKELKQNLGRTQMGNLPLLARGLCSNESALEVEAFFKPFIKDYEGGPRNMAETCELIGICAARKEHTSPLVTAFFNAAPASQVVSSAEAP